MSEQQKNGMTAELRKYITSRLDELAGVYVDPNYVTPKHLIRVLRLQFMESEQDMHFRKLDAGIEYIRSHEHMPKKVEWAAKLKVQGYEEHLWAVKDEQWGVDVEMDKPYWLTEKYQNNA